MMTGEMWVAAIMSLLCLAVIVGMWLDPGSEDPA